MLQHIILYIEKYIVEFINKQQLLDTKSLIIVIMHETVKIEITKIYDLFL